ncbi:MAG: Ig-like domain-containing protein [Clostridia bacterium]|nr:Ig-like domain-containing protein [Clostridia bacterium]
MKRSFSIILAFLVCFSACFACVTAVNNVDSVAESSAYPTPTFYVPELILMGSDTTALYFYGVNEDGSVTKDLPLSSAASGALVYWNLPGADSVVINARLSSDSYGSTEPTSTQVTDNGIASMRVGESDVMIGTDTYRGRMSSLTLSQTVPVGFYRFIEWTADYTINGQSYTQYAYTIVANTLTEHTVNVHCRNEITAHRDSFSRIILVIRGATTGNNASASQTDAGSCTATGTASVIYDSTRFSKYSAYPLTSMYRDFSYLTEGTGGINRVVNVPSASVGSVAESVAPSQITDQTAMTAQLTVEIGAKGVYRDNTAAVSARFEITARGVDKSDIRSAYQNVIKTQKSADWCSESTFASYKLSILKMAAKLSVPGSTDTSSPLPDDSDFFTQVGTVTIVHYIDGEAVETETEDFVFGDNLYADFNSYDGYVPDRVTLHCGEKSITPVETDAGYAAFNVASSEYVWSFYYKPDSYDVTYDLSGGKWDIDGEYTVEDGKYIFGNDAVFNAEYSVRSVVPTRHGYTFTGWLLNVDGRTYTKDSDTFIWTYTADDAVFTALWSKNPTQTVNLEYTIYYHDELHLLSSVPQQFRDSDFVWASSDSNTVTVDEEGKVTGVGRGIAVVTGTEADDLCEIKCRITVKFTWWQWILYILFFGWIWM